MAKEFSETEGIIQMYNMKAFEIWGVIRKSYSLGLIIFVDGPMFMAQHDIFGTLLQFLNYNLRTSEFHHFMWGLDTYFWAKPAVKKALINISKGCQQLRDDSTNEDTTNELPSTTSTPKAPAASHTTSTLPPSTPTLAPSITPIPAVALYTAAKAAVMGQPKKHGISDETWKQMDNYYKHLSNRYCFDWSNKLWLCVASGIYGALKSNRDLRKLASPPLYNRIPLRLKVISSTREGVLAALGMAIIIQAPDAITYLNKYTSQKQKDVLKLEIASGIQTVTLISALGVGMFAGRYCVVPFLSFLVLSTLYDQFTPIETFENKNNKRK